MVDHHLEALDRGSGDGRRRWKSMVVRPDLAAREEEERANMWGPHVSERDERRWWCPKAQTHEGNVFRRGAKGARAYRAGWVRQ
jgi:hypothetical protein